MAIGIRNLSALVQVLQIFATRGNSGAIPTACLSYPDVLVSDEELARFLPATLIAMLPRRSDSAEVRAYHNFYVGSNDLIETTALFQALGMDPVYLDIAELRGGEIVVDLNEGIPEALCEKFSLVIDTGTLEHCFNVGVAFKAMCSLLKQDGFVITAAPMTMINHGFWNFSPTAYHDFFTQNGFKVFLIGAYIGRECETTIEISLTARTAAPPNAGLLCIAQRVEVKPLSWPIQSKYKKMLTKGQRKGALPDAS
jgi:hypothetical protein